MNEKLLSLTIGGEVIEAPDGVVSGGNLAGILSWVINFLTLVGIVAALIFLIWGGVKWITSGGDKEKLQSARRTVLFSIIGLVVILLSVIIIQVTSSFLGITYFRVSP